MDGSMQIITNDEINSNEQSDSKSDDDDDEKAGNLKSFINNVAKVVNSSDLSKRTPRELQELDWLKKT